MIDNYPYHSNYTDRGSNGRDTKKGWERGILTPPLDIDRPADRDTLYCLRPSTRFRFWNREGRFSLS